MNRHQHSVSSNPFVKEAHAFLKEDRGNIFVISAMELKQYESRVPENPAFLHDKKLDVKPIRLAGWQEGKSLTVMYHAENPEQSKDILDLLLKGEGYYFDEIYPVHFKFVEEPLPEKFEILALNAIKRYWDTRPSYFKRA